MVDKVSAWSDICWLFTDHVIAMQLQELMELHKAKPSEDDRWRAFSYGKCKWLKCSEMSPGDLTFYGGLRGLRNHPTRIASYAEARSIKGVGDKTAQKVSGCCLSLSIANICAMEDYGDFTDRKFASYHI